MSETINSPLMSFPPEDDIVTTMGAPEPRVAAESAVPFTNMYRTYTPPAPGSFDPLTVAITGNIPAFFSYRQPTAQELAARVTASPSDGGDGDIRLPPLMFVPNPPGVRTIGGGPSGGIYIRNPDIPSGSPGTGNFLTDIQRALNTPGMRDAALALLTGPGAIPSIIAGTALSQLGSDPRVTTAGGALRDLLVDYARRTPEERELRREAAEGLNREAIRESDSRSGITVEDLPPLQNISQTYPADTGRTTSTDSRASAIDALYESILGRDPDAGAEAYWLDRADQVGWENALLEFSYGAGKELAARGDIETTGSAATGTTAPSGAPGTGNFAQDLGSFLSEPAVQDAIASLGIGAMTGGIGAGIMGAAQGAMQAGLVGAIADALGLSKGDSTSADFGGFSSAAAQAAAQTMSDAIAAGFGPESPGYGNNTSGGGNDTSDSNPGAGGDASQGGTAGNPSSDGAGGMGWKAGGLIPSEEELTFAEGGLVPLAGGGKIAIGPGGGLDDLIPTSINGRRAAALSDGEFVIPADVVSMMGDGSSNAGARRLYDLVRQVREAKTGTTRQAGPLPVGEILKRSIGR